MAKKRKRRRKPARHTPGPWRQAEDCYGCKEIHAVRYGEDGGLFSVQNIGYSHGLAIEREDQANVNLIAAAPDLLAMLEEMTRERKRLNEQFPSLQHRNLVKRAMKVIREAKRGKKALNCM